MDTRGDAPDAGMVYVMPDELRLAIRVALAAGRPLLLRGKPGSGKSSMAPFVAQEKSWRYYNYVVTSQTRARDLQWTFDGVRRLADAQNNRLFKSRELDVDAYVEPGPLWWAFAPESAAAHARRGAQVRRGAPQRAHAQDEYRHPEQVRNEGRKAHHSVVLIDEIDKADPDVPNGLLVPLASQEFTVAESGTRVMVEADPEALPGRPFHQHLVVITTNEERELPQAFLRRCVIAELAPPTTSEELMKIAEKHLKLRLKTEPERSDMQLAQALAHELEQVRESARRQGVREPSTAEYLDALWACRELGIKVGDDQWDAVRRLTLVKPQHLRK
ncbi:AAA family ATPase [Streptomyces sp. NPDC058869]|uniref:AAA family ATPase n=1 Tax=Streptomyces sp. NPDC058869 TaxID=3346659 RepID=UPI0036C38942